MQKDERPLTKMLKVGMEAQGMQIIRLLGLRSGYGPYVVE